MSGEEQEVTTNRIKNEYNITLLGKILAPDGAEKYQELLAAELCDSIIPWKVQVSGEDMPEAGIIVAVHDKVCDSFMDPGGSPQGYALFERERKLLYGVLWGRKAAESLMNQDFVGTKPSCNAFTDSRGDTYFHISLLPEGCQIAYSDRQLSWCKKHAPAGVLQMLSDEEIVNRMFTAWESFGDFKTSLPVEPELTVEEQDYIHKLFPEISQEFDSAKGPQRMTF